MPQPTRKILSGLVHQAVDALPEHKAFLADLMSAIERYDLENHRPSSKSYKPSSLACMRQMYYMRIGAEQDNRRSEYTSIGMADTGSRRHVAIQTVLENMISLGYDWEYVDVEKYVLAKQAEGKLLNITIVGKSGAETKLYDHTLHTSFLCDGIIRDIRSGAYYLFEFKNQMSFKYANKKSVDAAHKLQVNCYCTSLDLTAAFVVYENRDTCHLTCPELYLVGRMQKSEIVNRINTTEGYVERQIPPPKTTDPKVCQWCKYKFVCKKDG